MHLCLCCFRILVLRTHSSCLLVDAHIAERYNMHFLLFSHNRLLYDNVIVCLTANELFMRHVSTIKKNNIHIDYIVWCVSCNFPWIENSNVHFVLCVSVFHFFFGIFLFALQQCFDFFVGFKRIRQLGVHGVIVASCDNEHEVRA